MIDVPGYMPDTVPAINPVTTLATAGLLLVHEPLILVCKVMKAVAQTFVGPVMMGLGSTVRLVPLLQPATV